jgi:tRNA-splicing ligase RtcB
MMSEPAPIKMWLADPLKPEVARLLDRLTRAPDVRQVAVMPDVHAAEDVCVGAVLGTAELVYPQAVGADIGCGMTTVAMEGPSLGAHSARNVLRAIQRCVRVLTRPPGSGAGGPAPAGLSDAALVKAALRDGVRELGTLGRGNHFVEVQLDDADTPWILVHSGSRAMGQVITRHHLSKASPRGGLLALNAGSPQGQAYLADQAWACDFASASRRAILEDVAIALAPLGWRTAWGSLINSPHNLVRPEVHGGQTLMVHRKGAAIALAGQAGVIPGSAGTSSVHVEGRGCEGAMCSSSHGAGRLMSRGEAKRTVSASRLLKELGDICFDQRLAARLVDEAPSVYRDLRRVMQAQRELVKITRRLKPVVSFKGV